MSNQFGIPNKDEEDIRARDRVCVYCGKTFNKEGTYREKATIEHLNCDPPFYWADGLEKLGLAICCGECNSSRGKKTLLDWFKTKYCLDKNINKDTVTEPVKKYLRQLPVQIEQFIENSKWIFAKTMPEIPHYYIVRDHLSEGDKKLFDEFNEFIKNNGYIKEFYSKQYTCFNIDNYKYWVIENILNRAELKTKNN